MSYIDLILIVLVMSQSSDAGDSPFVSGGNGMAITVKST
jgi:hypothetical protein